MQRTMIQLHSTETLFNTILDWLVHAWRVKNIHLSLHIYGDDDDEKFFNNQ